MEKLRIYRIKPGYIRYLHNTDKRVNLKFDARPYIGTITMPNGIKYLLPLSSRTTELRNADGKERRSYEFTTFVRDGNGKEIANILHNNMIPAKEGTYTLMEITTEKEAYIMNEIRYIRKNREKIIQKAKRVYENKMTARRNDPFYRSMCCDFEKLERAYKEYRIPLKGRGL